MNDFFHPDDRLLLQKHGLDSFASLWDLQLEPVDRPNVERGGWSSVCRVDLDGAGFYLKRQANHLAHTFRRPLGEPTASREFRNIERYRQLGIPSLEGVFFGERNVSGEHRAILLTRALDGWVSLHSLLGDWARIDSAQRLDIVRACAELVGTLHANRLLHGCLYPKHFFMQCPEVEWRGRLIDLEKTRRFWFFRHGQVRDLEAFLRRVDAWTVEERLWFLESYLQASDSPGTLSRWQEKLENRRRTKEKRS